MMGWGPYDMGWFGMGAGLLLWLVVIGVVVWAVWRFTQDRRPGGTTPSDAEDILRRRLASGEIDTDEYERRLAMLRRG